MLRWYMKGSKVDVVCSSDAVSVFQFTNSCRNFVTHVADAFLQSAEIAERRSEDGARVEGGPAQVTNLTTFDPKDEPQVILVIRCARLSSTSLASAIFSASFLC